MNKKLLSGEKVNALLLGSLPLRAEDFRQDKMPARREAVPFVGKARVVEIDAIAVDVWEGVF